MKYERRYIRTRKRRYRKLIRVAVKLAAEAITIGLVFQISAPAGCLAIVAGLIPIMDGIGTDYSVTEEERRTE